VHLFHFGRVKTGQTIIYVFRQSSNLHGGFWANNKSKYLYTCSKCDDVISSVRKHDI